MTKKPVAWWLGINSSGDMFAPASFRQRNAPRQPMRNRALFARAIKATLRFLRDKVPARWPEFRDSVTDNFRVIDPKEFRVLA